ncbi:MAG: glycosyltransferase [Actinobacteria bacterium]|nr:glycosyltransferase [Actinomycetota bacterium]
MDNILSIITVTKNDLNGFIATIKSTRILREKFNINQIVVDSSKTGISDEVRKLSSSEKNIKYYWQEPKGISPAFNFGIVVSNTEWLWFLNGGDCVNMDLDCELFTKFLASSSADAIIFETKDMKSGRILEKKPPMWGLWPPLLSWIPHPSTVVKKKLFENYGNFNADYDIAMDYEVWLRFFSKNVNVDLASFAIASFNREGISYQMNRKTRTEVAKIIRKYFWTIIKKEFFSLRIVLKSLIINLPFVNYKKDMNKDLSK